MITLRQIPLGFVMNEPGKSIAIGVFILMTVLFVTQIVRGFQPVTVDVRNQEQAAKVMSQAAIDFNSPLFKKPLFGDYIPDPAMAEIKQSTLNFTVVGIMYSDQKEGSQVLLQNPDGKDHTYLVGDILPGGAVIQRIEKSRIIVLYKGALESLRLPRNELQFEAPPKPLLEE